MVGIRLRQMSGLVRLTLKSVCFYCFISVIMKFLSFEVSHFGELVTDFYIEKLSLIGYNSGECSMGSYILHIYVYQVFAGSMHSETLKVSFYIYEMQSNCVVVLVL